MEPNNRRTICTTLTPESVLPILESAFKAPTIVDVEQINQFIFPVSKSTIYALAARGEIQSAQIGFGRGRRLYLRDSIISWLQRRIAATTTPNEPKRKKKKDAKTSTIAATGSDTSPQSPKTSGTDSSPEASV